MHLYCLSNLRNDFLTVNRRYIVSHVVGFIFFVDECGDVLIFDVRKFFGENVVMNWFKIGFVDIVVDGF